MMILLRYFQNFSFERTTTEKSSFVEPEVRGPGPKNCKSFGKTNRVLQEALLFVNLLLFVPKATV
jgi:hypothetical protein